MYYPTVDMRVPYDDEANNWGNNTQFFCIFLALVFLVHHDDPSPAEIVCFN